MRLQHRVDACAAKRKGEPCGSPFAVHAPREGTGHVCCYHLVAAVAFCVAAVTSSVAFLTTLVASSCMVLPAAIISSTVSICTFFAISAKAAMFSAATSALADAKSVIDLA